MSGKLNAINPQERLETLKEMAKDAQFPANSTDVNNHIHTIYSFSPYSPAEAVWCAKNAGLATAGIMDHDSVAGLREFAEAGKIIGLPVTGGAEVRASFMNTPFADRRINNPDQDGNAYIAIHGIPADSIDEVEAFLAPLRQRRNERNKKMIARINDRMAQYDIAIDFDSDVVTLSQYNAGGSVTERHLLFALARKIIAKVGRGSQLVDFLRNELKLNVTEKIAGFLSDTENDKADYDLLGVLKSDTSMFYIPATDECADIRDIIKLADSVGAICAYAYLGDVGSSVTGDKRAQAFEDAYLDELFDYLKELGFKAVTYMPSRNTPEQLKRVRALCDKLGFMQISGEDINTPRQAFICPALRDPEFANLIDAAWALIGHEAEAAKGREYGIFGEKTVEKYPDLAERIKAFRAVAENKS